MNRGYYLDTPTPTEATSRFPEVQSGVYRLVIRRHGWAGWVFRFTDGNQRGARETLANLNWGLRVSA